MGAFFSAGYRCALLSALFLALLASPASSFVVKARCSGYVQLMRIFEASLEMFHKEVGRYPTEEEGLEALVARPETVDAALWEGPYLSKKFLPRDVWGNAFVYRCPGLQSEFEIISPGRDGKLGTGDDVNWWDPTTHSRIPRQTRWRLEPPSLRIFLAVWLLVVAELLLNLAWVRSKRLIRERSQSGHRARQ